MPQVLAVVAGSVGVAAVHGQGVLGAHHDRSRSGPSNSPMMRSLDPSVYLFAVSITLPPVSAGNYVTPSDQHRCHVMSRAFR